MAITSDQILDGVRRRYSQPTYQGLLSNADILAWANEIVQDEIIPIFESVNQNYFVRRVDIPIEATKSAYDIPYRGVARAVRELKMFLPNLGSQSYYNLRQIKLEDAYYASAGLSNQISGFYFEGDRIQLVPNGNGISYQTPQTLVVWYWLPPSAMVEYNAVAQVESVALDTVTVNSVPSTFSNGATVDFIQAKSGNNIYSMDISIVSSTSDTITFYTGDIPDELVPGDFIALSGQTYVLNFIPNECLPLIITLISRRSLQAQGDFEALKMIESDADMQRTNIMKIIEPRITGEPTICINRSNLARSRYSFYRGGYYNF